MTDYSTNVDLSRDRLAEMLGDSDEQFLYVIGEALERIRPVDACEFMPDTDFKKMAEKLRYIADHLDPPKEDAT